MSLKNDRYNKANNILSALKETSLINEAKLNFKVGDKVKLDTSKREVVSSAKQKNIDLNKVYTIKSIEDGLTSDRYYIYLDGIKWWVPPDFLKKEK